MYDFMMPYAMLGMTKIPEEQGIWAGKAALEIVKGSRGQHPGHAEQERQAVPSTSRSPPGPASSSKPELVAGAQVIK